MFRLNIRGSDPALAPTLTYLTTSLTVSSSEGCADRRETAFNATIYNKRKKALATLATLSSLAVARSESAASVRIWYKSTCTRNTLLVASHPCLEWYLCVKVWAMKGPHEPEAALRAASRPCLGFCYERSDAESQAEGPVHVGTWLVREWQSEEQRPIQIR